MPLYEETELLIPKQAYYILTFTLVATAVFMIVCTTFIDEIEWPMVLAVCIVFGFVTLLFGVLQVRIAIDEDKIAIGYIRTLVIPMDQIIDLKTGDIDVIRNYSGWGIKKVQFKTYACHGYEQGVSLKVKGRKVVTFTTADPEKVASLIKVHRGE